jgi:hypothetical protein
VTGVSAGGSANRSPGPPEHVVLKGPHKGPNVSEAARGRRVGRAGGLAGGDRAQRGWDHPGGCARRHRVRSRCGAPTLDGVGRPGKRSVGGREGRGAGGVDSCGGRGTSPTYPCLMCPRDHLGRWGLLGNGAKTVGNAAAWGWSSRCLPVGSAHPGGGEGLDGADHGGQGAAAPVEGDNDTEPCPQTALKRAAFGRSPGVVPGGPV